MILLKRTLQFFIICVLIGLITLISLYYYVKPDIPSVQVLKDVQLQTPMQVFTKDGLLINQFGEKRRIPVTIDEIPQTLINAFLATEDNRFYDHIGIDPIGIVRSAVVLISTGEKKQGASTITMQLARNFFLTREKAYIRKVKEIFIALHIEGVLTKDEILELYLNKIELGNRAFGIGAAAQVYYGKELKDLTLAQMAMIAGLPKAPSALNPIRNPTRAKARRNVVLGRLLTEDYITQEQYNEATSQPITAYFHGAEINLYAPYISEMVRAEMVSRYGVDKAYNSGFKIFTSVESKVQKAAQNALVNNLHSYDMRHGFRGPTDVLWNPETQPALTEQQILNKLQSVNELGTLKVAAVLSVNNKTATVLLKNGEQTTLSWDSLKWARKYITRYRQSFAPKAATDILTPGMQIWVRQNEDNSYLLSQIPEASSAIVSLDPQDGRIKAIVGGYSFEQSQYNRAIQAKRQVGSNIKPFIYSAALEKGYTLASILNDAPINQWDKSQGVAWRPKNSPAVYNGPIRIRRALAQSKNVISVRLLRGVGLQRTADHLLKFGFKDADINRSESLALGSASITPLELARGMSTFANGGHLIEPYFISEIQDAYGNILFKANPALACDEEPLPTHNALSMHNSDDEMEQTKKCAPRIISKQNAFLIADAMNSAIWGGGSWAHKTGWSGTGWRAQALDRRDISGKTGTTNDSVDTWFSGFNSNVMTSVWVGFDNPGNALGRSTYNNNLDSSQISGAESGAKTAQPAWVEFMKAALEGKPEAPIEPPEGLVSIRIDLATGLLSHKNDYTSRFEYFEKGTAPTKYVLSQPNDIFEEDTKTEEELF
ncbi:PBP1A family penicillin-binding protein [Pseudoalteromonas sp. NZS127_1]|uniref:penicillin-binding protein 1A n=1 Tax=unclassified Pseudoalteromonas TaxID=194690 RepID=UPI0018CD69EA|nr:PBP1A family penicillin-binding protein [Pseudoalteromonas sp. NZS127_1]MBH0011687.1 PBP1A family penicillin-binding protein [Pseudoalteromonas sp. NZS100_1]MBH0042161.1 PBP1A family penicillin-binding protein [Pseudoalteromonas sp. SWXJZ10B]MBH0051607.1 PBP1A family penicillin-binding protein [Pseudoalteromonas sp. SWYJZ19]MBH0075746.1 PBP1A family penicillin-binding protein [Pseudoalteromonas sp. SWYJ118]